MPSAFKSAPTHGDFTIKEFDFAEGRSLRDLRIHYRTLGVLQKDSNGTATNAVILLHGTTSSGEAFLQDEFAGELFGRGQLLSAEEYYLIMPDNIGHGRSARPSDSLRAQFPRYSYGDMVRIQHTLLTQHLGVNHLRLVIGFSMGGMHTWLWGSTYPDFMDALMPIVSLPIQISGRNRMWRKHAIDSIRNDPDFKGGNYEGQLYGLQAALHVMAWMGSSPLLWQRAAPDSESADKFIGNLIDGMLKTTDANDFAYAMDASWDYDPGPRLKEIKAPLTAVNCADDQINPPELGILESEIKKVSKGKAVMLPISEQTIGHATWLVAKSYDKHLADLLERSSMMPKANL